MTDRRTAVFIHGCHLQADLNGKDWDDLVWGRDTHGKPSLYGRAVMGIKAAVEYGAEVLIFASGGSERDGVKEGEYTRQRALAMVTELATLIDYPGGAAGLADYLNTHSIAETTAVNTSTEAHGALAYCVASGIDRLILVSNPWHLPRCLLEASAHAEHMREEGKTLPQVLGLASFGETEGAAVTEPPHRGDGPRHHGPELVRKLHRALGKAADVETLERDVYAAIDRHYPEDPDKAILT